MIDAMIAHANSAGDRWAAWAVAGLLDAALLLGMIGPAWLAIRHRVAPQVGYCLFLLIPLKLLVPVVVTVPAALARWTPSGLVASWLDRARGPEGIEGRPRLETRIVADRTEQSAPTGPKFGPPPRPRLVVAKPRRSIPATDARSSGDVAPATAPPARPVAGTPRLTAPAIVMIAWLAAVLLLLGRLARTQWRFRSRLRRMSPLDDPRLGIDLRELGRLAGVSGTIRIAEDDSIAAPGVWGIVRPTIVMPRGIDTSLTDQQLRWVLLHELAHVRRRDLLVVGLQRFAAILHFFNPAIWVANRLIDQLREYACDDLAVSLGHSSAIESGEAFVSILRHADRRRRGLEGALGVFGLDSRASCFLRVRRLLDAERPIRTAPGKWSLCGLILLAVFSLPHVRAAGEAAAIDPQDPAGEPARPGRPEPKAAAGEGLARDGKDFELRVAGPGGEPISGALVEFRTSPVPTAGQIRRGKFIRKGPYGALATTDAEGLILVEFPTTPTSFNVSITTPGYGPYWASWSSEAQGQPLPPRFTAELEPGWSVGGIVVDAGGKPVEGVKIHPNLEFKKRPGDHRQMAIGARIRTDHAGKWRFDSVPASMGEVSVEIDHPDFGPVRRPLTRGEFGIDRDREPASKLVLERGLTVSGKVTDEDGRPIVGTLVRTKFINDVREARTGDDGVYRLVGCEPRSARIVASAKGRATDMKELTIDREMGPVDFRMKPGGTVRIRVLDERGDPAPRARIFFQRWRGPFSYFEFAHVGQYADENGAWSWDEAPLDEFKADICPPGGMGMQLLEQPLIARQEEYVFRLPATLVVSGKVVDAATKQPIPEFRVVPGIRSSETHMNWVRGESFTASGGRYQIRQTRGYLAHLVRIEADGYQAAVSRDIKSTEGNVSIDFELKRGNDVAAKVVTPGLLPAAGAKVALGVAGSQINIENGKIDDGLTFSARAAADDAGLFHFPAQDGTFQLIITHPTGYAQIKSSPDWQSVRTITLEPWARVEGIFRVGRDPVANVPITLNLAGRDSFGTDPPHIVTHHDVTTGPDGRFVFERVIPGSGWIGRRIMMTVNDGAADVTSSCMIAADFPAGKTVRIDLGGTGRPVVGRLQPSGGLDQKVRWNFALVTAAPESTERPAAGPRLTATVARDGTFRIDDVPTGDYSLRVRFERDDAGFLQGHRFQVPPPEGDPAALPVDLGTMKLRASAPR